MGRAWDYLPMVMVMLCGKSEDRIPAVLGTIVGGVFHPNKQLARFSPPNMPYIIEYKFI